MLGAVMFGHRGFQPVIDAIIKLAELAAKEPRDFTAAELSRARDRRCSSIAESRPARRLQDHRQAGALRRRRRRQGEGQGSASAAQGEEPPKWTAEQVADGRSRTCRPRSSAGTSSTPARRIDGRDLKTVRPIVVGSRHPAAHPRLGAVHPRRDAGARGRHARHRRGRAVCRQRSTARTRRPSCCTTTSRPTRSVKPAAWARRAAAKSATASSPGAPSARCCRPPSSSPTRCASSPRSPSPTARPRWRRSAAPRWR